MYPAAPTNMNAENPATNVDSAEIHHGIFPPPLKKSSTVLLNLVQVDADTGQHKQIGNNHQDIEIVDLLDGKDHVRFRWIRLRVMSKCEFMFGHLFDPEGPQPCHGIDRKHNLPAIHLAPYAGGIIDNDIRDTQGTDLH